MFLHGGPGLDGAYFPLNETQYKELRLSFMMEKTQRGKAKEKLPFETTGNDHTLDRSLTWTIIK